MPCIFRNRKRIIFATNIKSRSFYSSFDIARRYAKHRVEDYLYATENRVKKNKSGLLSFSDDLKRTGDNATTAGLEMAAVGVWFEGVGAAPGVIVTGVGELVSKTGAIVGIGVEILSKDYSTNNTTDKISDKIESFIINGTVDAAIPGTNPSKEIIKGFAGKIF
jgi:hypothetical protein